MLRLPATCSLAPPVLLFGPLAGLLLLSRPGTLREWVWMVGAGTLVGRLAAAARRTGGSVRPGRRGAADRHLRGPDALAALARLSRALTATALAGAALVDLDVASRASDGREVQRAVEHDLWTYQS